MARRYTAGRRHGSRYQERLTQPKPPARPAPPPYQPPTPATTPDATYQGQSALNLRNRQDVLTRYGNPQAQDFRSRYGQEGENLARQYGFEGYDSPLSLARQMEASYQTAKLATQQSSAARGQYYSTAYDQYQGENERNYNVQQSQLQQNYQAGLGKISEAATEGLGALEQGDIDAYQAWVDRMIATTPQPVAKPPAAAAATRVNPMQTQSHAAAGLRRVGTNTYVGPNGTFWHRTKAGTFAKGKA
jgi:hypothetical protein